jgi:histidinol-phosphate aminotransferase
MNMSKYWSELTKKLEPYVPGEQPKDKKYVKLNTNENPYPPSPNVDKILKNFNVDSLKLYPDPNGDLLKDSVANNYGLANENIFLGNGSDEILAFAFMAFFNKDKKILFPDISYSFYPVYANIFDIPYETVKLNEDFTIPVKEFLNNNGGIVIPNPNAPTGIVLSIEEIEEILAQNINNVVIIDEAYVDFGAESAIQLISKYENLLIIQTLSKSRSLAGIRVGYALGNKSLIDGLERVKNSINSYTIDRVSLIVATEAIKDKEYFEENCKKIIETRTKVVEELRNLGFKVCESKANFIFISHKNIKANLIFSALKEAGVLVRFFNKERIDNYLRVTIGSSEEMKIFIDKIKIILSK